MKKKNIYVLGVGLSHDGSACLLKDGRIAVAIEKERITRIKHDGGNDTTAINYCLQAEGITLKDIDLVVQNSNYGFFEFGNDYYLGDRLFTKDVNVPVVTISHHLAHAYNAAGTSPFKKTDILVIDGCGSLYDECIDLLGAIIAEDVNLAIAHLYAEKDSFYHFDGQTVKSVYKDFSPFGLGLKHYPMHPPTTMHSIGGLYSAVSLYCLNGFDDIGKLMGLAPYGRKGAINDKIFDLRDGRVFVRYDWMKSFREPSRGYNKFKSNFQYYADIAYWVQQQVQEAILYVIQSRHELSQSSNLSYSGGVALNAVANSFITKLTDYKSVYMTPSAGDNGIAVGCAFYGWLQVLQNERVTHNGGSYYGKSYPSSEIESELAKYLLLRLEDRKLIISQLMGILPLVDSKPFDGLAGKTVQLNIQDIHNYLVSFGEKITISLETCPAADVKISLTSVELIRCLMDEAYFGKIQERVFIHPASKTFIKGLQSALGVEDGCVHELNRLSDFVTIERADFSALYSKVSALLANGKIIGWYQGGSEFGPRALGHRSILADPRKQDVQHTVNAKIKFREDFRPFAPSVLFEDVAECFDFSGESPYMIMIAQAKEHWKDRIPAVVHADGSSRIQTVKLTDDERYYRLIESFKKLTGVPMLLNTSFNRKGMPIVETPAEALDFFFECDLDCLVMENYIISKKGQLRF